MEFTQDLGALMLTVLSKVAVAAAIVIAGRILAKFIVKALVRVLNKSNVDTTLVSFFEKLTLYSLYTLMVLIALTFLGIPMTSIVAVLGASTLAIGIALQDSIGNLAAGVLIIALRPFKVDDYVEIDDASGYVNQIGFFNTSLTTRENKTVFIPNKTILDGNLINYSLTELIRLDLVYGISYSDDVRKAKRILEEIVVSDDRVAEHPKPQVSVCELGDSSVNFAVWPYVMVDDEIDVANAITERVKLRFDAEGISIPFPQRDVYLHRRNGSQAPVTA